MSEAEKERLIQLIESDLKKLLGGIVKHEPGLAQIIHHIKIGIPLFSINLSYFTQMINKYCFNITMETPLTIDREEFKLMEERFQLVSNIFLKNNFWASDEALTFPFHLLGFHPPTVGSIFYLLYYAIFKRFISTSETISDIFKDLYEKWMNSFQKKKMLLSLITYLPVSAELGDYKISENFALRSIRPHIKLADSPFSILQYKEYILSYFSFGDPRSGMTSPMPCYLVYQKDVDFEFNPIFKEGKPYVIGEKGRAKFNDQEKKIEGKFYEMINSMCLFGKDFKFDGYIIELPWWLPSDFSKYDKLKQVIKAHELRVLQKDEIQEFVNFYSNIEKSRIFLDKEQGIIANRYFQIYNREDLPDIILDTCIILEILFTRNMRQELKYRLCLNGASFLASTWDEFKEYNKILSNIYDLRSIIVHGGNWKKKINELMRDDYFRDEYQFIFEVRQLINKILRKLVNLLVDKPDILNEFSKKNYFLENSDIIKRS